jgi:hypothetical protein
VLLLNARDAVSSVRCKVLKTMTKDEIHDNVREYVLKGSNVSTDVMRSNRTKIAKRFTGYSPLLFKN